MSRHPHVFGDADVQDAEGVLRQWAALKREEKKAKGGGASVLEGVPRELPALARADRLTEKASRIGFDWPDAAGAREKVAEELGELDEAIASGDRDAIEHELGDALFALANLGRKLGLARRRPSAGPVGRFITRFEHVERELERRGVPHGEATLAEMDALWDEAKSLERQGKTGDRASAVAGSSAFGERTWITLWAAPIWNGHFTDLSPAAALCSRDLPACILGT